MSKEVEIKLRDDISHQLGDDVQTRLFSFNGVDYEIELSEKNFGAFTNKVQRYLDVARKATPPPKKKTSSAKKAAPATSKPKETEDTSRAELREWAMQNGYEVAERGQISNEVREAYARAHEGID